MHKLVPLGTISDAYAFTLANFVLNVIFELLELYKMAFLDFSRKRSKNLGISKSHISAKLPKQSPKSQQEHVFSTAIFRLHFPFSNPDVDYEKCRRHNLILTDPQVSKIQTIVTVNVLDLDEFAPEIVKGPNLSFFADKSASPGKILGTIETRDKDMGNFGIPKFTTTSELVKIESTGNVVLRKYIAEEQISVDFVVSSGKLRTSGRLTVYFRSNSLIFICAAVIPLSVCLCATAAILRLKSSWHRQVKNLILKRKKGTK